MTKQRKIAEPIEPAANEFANERPAGFTPADLRAEEAEQRKAFEAAAAQNQPTEEQISRDEFEAYFNETIKPTAEGLGLVATLVPFAATVKRTKLPGPTMRFNPNNPNETAIAEYEEDFPAGYVSRDELNRRSK